MIVVEAYFFFIHKYIFPSKKHLYFGSASTQTHYLFISAFKSMTAPELFFTLLWGLLFYLHAFKILENC